ncbi:MAG: hypothetical protein EOO77_47780 [Oxalobacteraceae bacterium]|nr:MAG: hypothetical protein EOO77_47780 [Oxalobacteraceae bacterium]
MQDDNPLWCDYAEPDEAPCRTLLVLAGLVSIAMNIIAATIRVCRMSDQLWPLKPTQLAQTRRVRVEPL